MPFSNIERVSKFKKKVVIDYTIIYGLIHYFSTKVVGAPYPIYPKISVQKVSFITENLFKFQKKPKKGITSISIIGTVLQTVKNSSLYGRVKWYEPLN